MSSVRELIKSKYYPKTLEDIECFIVEQLQKDFPKQDMENCERLAYSSLIAVSRHLRGWEFYIPRGATLENLLNGLEPTGKALNYKYTTDIPHLIDAITSQLITDFPHQLVGYNKSVACSALRGLSYYCGGNTFYLPKCTNLHKAERDAQMYNEFKTLSINALSIKYDLGQRAIYDAIAKHRKLLKTLQQSEGK